MNDSTERHIDNCRLTLNRVTKHVQKIFAEDTLSKLEAKVAQLEQLLALKYSRAYAVARA